MPAGPSRLEELRRKIADVDASIAASVQARLELAREVAEAKALHREPTRDFSVEASVVGRWRAWLATAGIPPGRADAFARWLIEESVRVQEARAVPVPAASGSGRRIAVIGGSGAMGGWLCRYFEDAGHRVSVVDPRPDPVGRPMVGSVEQALQDSDVLVFATPIRNTAPLLRRTLETPSQAVVFDVLSVKAPIAAILQAGAQAGRLVTSVHPMFGSSARTLSGRNLLVVSCGVPSADAVARALFAGSALSIAEVPLERHDLLMAESLGLAHAVNLLFLASLAADPASPHELARAASTTFHRQSSLARSVAEEGPELYLDIQSLNPNSWGMYQELRQALDRLEELVERKDLERFTDLLRGGVQKLAPGTEPMRQ